ncbi:MAG: OadG family protein [Clostridiales bacterium]|nr:OadG family protein [Clostridiales bacterium]
MYLGVFHNSFGGMMTFKNAVIISLVGFLIVFVILSLLAVFVKIMGTVFLSAENRKKRQPKTVELTEADPVFNTLNLSRGDIDLINVSEKDAAIIMAITSHKIGIPLNRLKFNSIRLMEEEK